MSHLIASKALPYSSFKLDLKGGELLCDQIASHYRKKIHSGVYREGMHLPTCREVGRMLSVSVQTVNRAFDILAAEGLVFRRRSVGTVVTFGQSKRQYTRRPRSPRQAALPICQVVRMSAISREESDLFYDYQSGLIEGFDVWRYRFEVAYLQDTQPDLDLVKMLVEERQARGIVAHGLNTSADRYLLDSGFPTVFLGHPYAEKEATSVIADYVSGYCEAWKYVDQLGHRKAAFFGMQNRIFENRYRECASGYALAHPKCKLSAKVGVPLDADERMIWERLVKAFGPWNKNMQRHKWPTLIFAQTDVIAAKLIRVLRENGICVPRDISIIGYNNSQVSRHCDPLLTTLAVPRYEMALAAARLLLDLFAGRPSAKGAQQIFPVHLVQRESCRQI